MTNKAPQTVTEKENWRAYRLETVVRKTMCHWGGVAAKPGSGVQQTHTYLKRSSYKQTSTSCFGELAQTTELDNVACKSTQT
jgi:hypothetical protein